MTSKERNEHLINKWGFMLEPLDKKKTAKARYAKMFENTALHSNTSTIKLALPLLQRILFEIPNIKGSASSKTTYLLGEFDTDSVIDGNIVMPDGAAAWIEYMKNAALEKFETDLEKLNHIMLTTSKDKIKVYLLY